MSSVSPAKDATQLQDVESVIAQIKSWVKLLDCLVLVDTVDPEVSGVLTVDGETFREVLPLGDGIHLVLSLGSLPTKLGCGIHEIEV